MRSLERSLRKFGILIIAEDCNSVRIAAFMCYITSSVVHDNEDELKEPHHTRAGC